MKKEDFLVDSSVNGAGVKVRGQGSGGRKGGDRNSPGRRGEVGSGIT